MRIKDIHIENFKGIEVSDFAFNNQFTVLIGDNGRGKSSILDAVSIGLGTILMKSGAEFGYGGAKSRSLFKSEIRKVITTPDNSELSNVLLKGVFIFKGEELSWKRAQPVTSMSLSFSDADSLTDLGEEFAKNLTTEMNFPLFAHHTTARLWGKMYDRKVRFKKLSSRLDGYYTCLDSRSVKDNFLVWFKTYEDSVLKFNKEKDLYQAFTQAIISMVKDWTEIRFSWDHDDILGKTASGNWLPLKNLSDGYRGIVNLAADIAYRAIKLNPHLGERAVLDTEGIVLIDEIDMHLHPKWQRHIVSDLKKTFPKIQFIATTHSPFIVQSLNAEEIINLDGEDIVEDPFTKSIEEIVEQDMDMPGINRSQKFLKYQQVAARYFDLIQKGKNSVIDVETKVLKFELDRLELEFIDDPVYVALMQAERKSEL
jgi:predicted ATP-binding protein involved in virulence